MAGSEMPGANVWRPRAAKWKYAIVAAAVAAYAYGGWHAVDAFMMVPPAYHVWCGAAFIAYTVLGWFGPIMLLICWSVRLEPPPGTERRPLEGLRQALLKINAQDAPFRVKDGKRAGDLVVEWDYADKKWLGLAGPGWVKRGYRMTLRFDPAACRVRSLEESWSGDAGLSGIRWGYWTGVSFFQYDYGLIPGLFVENGALKAGAYEYRFALPELKNPVIDLVTSSGWTFQPVSASPRWLLEDLSGPAAGSAPAAAAPAGSLAARHPYVCGLGLLAAFTVVEIVTSDHKPGTSLFNAAGLAAGGLVGRHRVDGWRSLGKELLKFLGFLAALALIGGYAGMALSEDKSGALWLFVFPMIVVGSAPMIAFGLFLGWQTRPGRTGKGYLESKR